MQQVVANMKKLTVALLASASLVLSGCASYSQMDRLLTKTQFQDAKIEGTTLDRPEFVLPKPANGPVVVAVYSFLDRTGQRKPSPMVAQLSSAVTQGSETYLIKALQDVGNGSWFKVVERVGLDNLMKERQMIRQMREIYEGANAKPMPPMLFAGVLVEGGIVGYDSNVVTGGSGMRILGIGPQTQYQADMITVSLRVVSVTTGEVLVSITTTKTVYSYMDKLGVLRFVEAGTKSIEAEIGMGVNESGNRATNMAIQAAVVEMIREGQKRGFWDYDPKSVEEIRLADEAKKKAKEEAQILNKLKNTLNGKEKKDAVEPKTNLIVDGSGVTVKTGESQ
jgi:curli production assembly/transport component CsgG